MRIDPHEALAALLPAALLLLAALLAWGVVRLVPDTEGRIAMGLLAIGLLAAGAGALLRRAWLHWGRAAQRLAEDATSLAASAERRELAPQGGLAALAGAINQLTAQRAALRDDMAQQVREAGRGIEQERSRLAALMAELTQSVVVCNLDGRILLYNARARLQFRALSAAPQVAGGVELIGVGRSIYALLDRALIAHAIESVRERLARGAAHPSAQFTTGTRAGQLLRVQMAPVRSVDGAALDGFVLMLDNITREVAADHERDALLQRLGEGSRAALANVQAALEMLDYPDLDAATRERFLAVVRDEVRALGARVQQAAASRASSHWPLEDMQGEDLLATACRRIEAASGCAAQAEALAPGLWLAVDSWALLQALAGLAARLAEEHGIRRVRLRLARAETAHARLDLVWSGPTMSTETVMGWEHDALRVQGQTLALTLRDVVERHGGEFWFERERARHESFFRLLLPLAAEREPLEATDLVRGEARPEVYDFDLFARREPSRSLAEQRLADLAYTVFDTETTGLDPSAGDQIIQIGAARIVAGKLRREDCFEQLVDPQRSIPEAGIAIHRITPAMLRGAPTLDTVLPAFHAYAHDTVLVAHNAAFDMRFLELARERCGVTFEQPVLDTLLLAMVAQPAQASHGLEALAERLGVPLLGRHTALGDALVAAELFLKLIPLLAERGVHTLGQALEASRQTSLARLAY